MILNTKVSAIIPTRNEEIHIKDAIASVSFADEIIVIDSYSEDNTLALAQTEKVKILQRKFDDFSSQKNFALEHASFNWVYILDADERVSKELEREIIEKLKNPGNFVGFYIYRNFYFLGKRIKFSGWQHDKVIRLFRKDKCSYDGKLVHEKIIADGSIGYFKNRLDHYSYRNYDHHVNKLNHYAGLKAKMMYEKGTKTTYLHILLKPAIRFLIHYIIKLGFLDGYPGYVLAKLQAYGMFTKYVKFWEMKKKG